MLLTKSLEGGKKKKGGKAAKKPKCSPWKGKHVLIDMDDEESASSSSASDSDKTLSADPNTAAKASNKEEKVEAPGADAQCIDALNFTDDEVKTPVNEEPQGDALPSPKASCPMKTVDRDLSFAQEEIQEFFGEFPIPSHVL